MTSASSLAKTPSPPYYAVIFTSQRTGGGPRGAAQARLFAGLGRSWQRAVEILAIVVLLWRAHKHFRNIAGSRSTGSLKQIQGNAQVVGASRGKDCQRECICECLSPANLPLTLGSVRRFENGY